MTRRVGLFAAVAATALAPSVFVGAGEPKPDVKPVTKPEFHIKADFRPRVEEADGVVATFDKDGVIVRITSIGGIGSADITLVRGEWPKRVVLLFPRQKFFESFGVTHGPVRLTGAVSPENIRLRLYRGKGDKHRQEDAVADPATWKPTVRLTPAGIEIALPADFCRKEHTVLQIGWIDAFRG